MYTYYRSQGEVDLKHYTKAVQQRKVITTKQSELEEKRIRIRKHIGNENRK